jgi:hypothetical protein
MEIELEARLLQQIVNLADSLEIDRLQLTAGADGLQIIDIGNGHITAIAATLPYHPKTFRKYVPDEVKKHVEGDKVQVCYHDLDAIKDVLKLVELPESTIGIKTVPENYDVIDGEITLGALTRSYRVSQNPPCKMSEWNYKTMPSHAGVIVVLKEFYNAVKAAVDISDVMTLQANKERFSMEADKVNFDGRKADAAKIIDYAEPKDGSVEATFNTGYLLNMAKAIPPKMFELWMSKDFPLTANFQLFGAPGSKVTYVIAPHNE